jgi:hypothetical protein
VITETTFFKRLLLKSDARVFDRMHFEPHLAVEFKRSSVGRQRGVIPREANADGQVVRAASPLADRQDAPPQGAFNSARSFTTINGIAYMHPIS